MNKGDPCCVIRHRLQAGDVAIDVGAGVGTEAHAMATAVGPTGQVYALEPDPRRWKALAATIVGLPVTIRREAAGAHTGEAVLYQAATSSDQSSLYEALARESPTPLTVSLRRLDDLPVTTVALVKIDAQGAELAILQGAPRLLETCPCWIVELWPHGLHVAGTSAQALVQHLRDAGLTVHSLGEDPALTDAMLTTWVGQCSPAHYVNIEARR